MRTLESLPESFAVCRLDASAAIPQWAWTGAFCQVTRTRDELSIVCAESAVPADARAERGWRAFRVAGTLDFALTGVLAGVALPLAQAGVSIFAVSTFDTDYILVRSAAWEKACRALTEAGFTFA